MAEIAHYQYQVGTTELPGWIAGSALQHADKGEFNQLLWQIGARINTAKRKIIAASFALRFGWSAGAPIAIFIQHGTVLNLSLENVNLRFCEAKLFQEIGFNDLDVINRITEQSATALLAEQLFQQAAPVVESLYQWSKFSRRALWAMIVSSWCSQAIQAAQACLDRSDIGYQLAEALMNFRPEFIKNKPIFYSVQAGSEQRIFQKRQACCLYYLNSADRSFCTSCPLIEDTERVERSFAYLNEYQQHAISH